MKRLLMLTFFYLTCHVAFGQACGIYRIEYVGTISSNSNEVVRVYLPNTVLLHGLKNEKFERSFIDTNLTNGNFSVKIGSHLTTPYNKVDHLLSFYKAKLDKFKMKVSYKEDNLIKEKVLEIDWNNIEVSIIDDGKFGTLFRFNLKEIRI